MAMDWGDLPTWVGSIGTMCGFGAALFQISQATLSEKRRDTFEQLRQMTLETDVSRDVFLKFRTAAETSSTTISLATTSTDLQKAIRLILNQYELIALGINLKAYDEKTVRRLWKSTVLNDWSHLEMFIRDVRKTTSNPNAYCETEKLVDRWKAG